MLRLTLETDLHRNASMETLTVHAKILMTLGDKKGLYFFPFVVHLLSNAGMESSVYSVSQSFSLSLRIFLMSFKLDNGLV